MTRIAIVAARRTPFGRFGGGLASFSPVELAAVAATATLKGIDPEDVDLVVLGNVLAAGHGMNIARQAAVHAGLPIETPAWSVNMMCGSGLQAAVLGVQAIRSGEARAVLVGGVESMSQAPLLLPRPPKGASPDLSAVVDSMQRDGLIDSFSRRHMGETVEELARERDISRAEQDAFAERSQRLHAAAAKEGRFTDELVAVGGLHRDEHPRPEVTRESLSQLRTVFDPQGSVTAGNSSGINDGAAMILLADWEWAQSRGWPVLAEWREAVSVGCDPQRMGLGPVHAIRKLFQKTESGFGDIDSLEINEAFAAQTLACLKEMELELSGDDLATRQGVALKFNPDGGAIAVGHPLGASGARLLTHLAHRIARGESQRGIVSLCIGGGMGIAALIDRPNR